MHGWRPGSETGSSKPIVVATPAVVLGCRGFVLTGGTGRVAPDDDTYLGSGLTQQQLAFGGAGEE